MSAEQAFVQLQMVWPEARLADPPTPSLSPGYRLRTYLPGDESGWIQLMAKAGWPDWDDERRKTWMDRLLPQGWFMAIHQESGQITASAMSVDNPVDLHPAGGELGWVCADPSHAGRGLGLAVCAAVTRRFIQAGYQEIYLKTDDFRLPALKTYFKLGYVPLLFQPDMYGRWQAVCERLDWPFTPEAWKAVGG